MSHYYNPKNTITHNTYRSLKDKDHNSTFVYPFNICWTLYNQPDEDLGSALFRAKHGHPCRQSLSRATILYLLETNKLITLKHKQEGILCFTQTKLTIQQIDAIMLQHLKRSFFYRFLFSLVGAQRWAKVKGSWD